MKALIIQTMLALLIPGLSDTPKALLTPPNAYDFSFVSTPDTEYISHSWTYGTPTSSFPLILDNNGGNSFEYYEYDPITNTETDGNFIWNNTIYSIENSYAVATIQLKVKTPDIVPLSETTATWASNYLFGSLSRFEMIVDNYSKYPIVLYFDSSSSTLGGYPLYFYYNGRGQQFYQAMSGTALSLIYLPPFSVIRLSNQNTLTYLNAIYCDVISPTATFQDYEDYITDEAFNSGYNDGYTTAYDEFGNFDWLSSLFTTMGDLLAIEILPGITIGLILLIPIVFGVLRFIMGLFR